MADGDQEYLKGSIKIPKSKWTLLPEGSEISYYRNDGKFVKRAFVKLFYKSKESEDYVMCSNKLHKFEGDTYYSEFRLKLSNVQDIYKRISQDSIIEYKLIKAKLDQTIEELSDKINVLTQRLEEESEKTKTLAKLFKQLYERQKKL